MWSTKSLGIGAEGEGFPIKGNINNLSVVADKKDAQGNLMGGTDL